VTVLFQELPSYNDKRRGTISTSTLRNLQRSRSNPQLNLLFQPNTGDPASPHAAAGASQGTDTSPARAAATLSGAYQHQTGGFVAHGRQDAEPRRSSILSNCGETAGVILD